MITQGKPVTYCHLQILRGIVATIAMLIPSPGVDLTGCGTQQTMFCTHVQPRWRVSLLQLKMQCCGRCLLVTECARSQLAITIATPQLNAVALQPYGIVCPAHCELTHILLKLKCICLPELVVAQCNDTFAATRLQVHTLEQHVILATDQRHNAQLVGIVRLYFHDIGAMQRRRCDVQFHGRWIHNAQSAEYVDFIVLRENRAEAQSEANTMRCLIAGQANGHGTTHSHETALANAELMKGIGAPDEESLGQCDGTRNVPATADGLHRNFLQMLIKALSSLFALLIGRRHTSKNSVGTMLNSLWHSSVESSPNCPRLFQPQACTRPLVSRIKT